MKLRSKLFYSYLFFLIVYSGFVLLPKPSAATLAQYNLSAGGLRLIYLTIILIIAAIWFAGFYGYARLHAYTEIIKRNKDGKQVAKLTRGIFLLVMWLPISSVISSILSYCVVRHPEFRPASMIINHYISLIFPLAGFVFIGMGARGLSELTRKRPKYHVTNALTLLIIYIGVIFYRLVATTEHRDAIYHMSIWLILTTLVVPYIYMWFIGLLAAYELYIYSHKVEGIVYRKSWGLLAFGIGWLIVTSIVFQYLSSLTPRLVDLSIYWLLAIIYALLLVLSVGFVLIAMGTSKLQKIEEV